MVSRRVAATIFGEMWAKIFPLGRGKEDNMGAAGKVTMHIAK